MHIHQAELTISAVRPSQYPDDNLPEFALAGRSNVGKSSFINKMINRKGLARTSSQPGKTQTLNFYTLDNRFRFVDVPGYGYARVSKSHRESWLPMVETYLTERDNIRVLFLLMDARHEPTDLDCQMFEFAESLDIPYAIVLTKIDKVKRNQWNKCLSVYQRKLGLPSTDALFPVSSKTGEGMEILWEIISEFL